MRNGGRRETCERCVWGTCSVLSKRQQLFIIVAIHKVAVLSLIWGPPYAERRAMQRAG